MLLSRICTAEKRSGARKLPKEVNMSANFEAKKAVVEEIKEKIRASKSVVLVQYDRLTVA